jgi:hypothetical protein
VRIWGARVDELAPLFSHREINAGLCEVVMAQASWLNKQRLLFLTEKILQGTVRILWLWSTSRPITQRKPPFSHRENFEGPCEDFVALIDQPAGLK